MVFPLWFVILYVTASKDKHVAAVVLSSSSILIISCMGFKGTLVVFYLWSLKPYFSIVIILLRGEGEWFPRCTSHKQSCALRHKSLSGELWESFGSWNRADNVLEQTSCFLDAQIWLLTVFFAPPLLFGVICHRAIQRQHLFEKKHNCHCFQFYYWIRIVYSGKTQND